MVNEATGATGGEMSPTVVLGIDRAGIDQHLEAVGFYDIWLGEVESDDRYPEDLDHLTTRTEQLLALFGVDPAKWADIATSTDDHNDFRAVTSEIMQSAQQQEVPLGKFLVDVAYRKLDIECDENGMSGLVLNLDAGDQTEISLQATGTFGTSRSYRVPGSQNVVYDTSLEYDSLVDEHGDLEFEDSDIGWEVQVQARVIRLESAEESAN